MCLRLLASFVVVVILAPSAWAENQIMFAQNEPLTGQRSFCAVVSNFRGLTKNYRADSFWLAVRFSRDVPYSVKVNGKLVKSKDDGTLNETDFDNSNGDNITVTVTRDGQYQFDVNVTAPVKKFTLALNWFNEAASTFSIRKTSCSK